MAPPRPVPDRRARLRTALAATAAAGAALLLASTFMTVIAITVDGSSRVASADTHLSGWDRHGPALPLLALAALGLALGAARGARACMAALAACGVAALAIVLVGDLPDINETGLIGQVYADAEAGPRFGWYAETAGGVLLALAGVVLATAGLRHLGGAELSVLLAPAALVLAATRRLVPSFRATSAGFES